MSKDGSVTRLEVEKQQVWLKRYGTDLRTVRLRTLDWFARLLRLPSLRPPPRLAGVEARLIEQRRLDELTSLDVNVPQVLGAGEDCLLLSDMGQTLSSLLRKAEPDEARVLLLAAMQAIAEVHQRGGYLGAPVARNLTISHDGRIGFLDFEEDPGQVMPLLQAQARDWLMFASGVAHHVPFDEDTLGEIFAQALHEQSVEVCDVVDDATSRLSFLRSLIHLPGRRLPSIGKAVGSLQRALWSKAGLAVVLILGAADLLHDGELEIIEAFMALIG